VSDFPPQPASKPVEASADFLANIIGDPRNVGERIQAGPVLRMMYETALSVAMRHSGARAVLVGFDRVDLPSHIRHLDLVRMEGQVVEVGQSSMIIEIRCEVKPHDEREFVGSNVGFVTMVAVDAKGQPLTSIPALDYDSPAGSAAKALAHHRKAQLAERQAALEWIDEKHDFQLGDVLEPEQSVRYEYLRPSETALQFKGQVISPGSYLDGRVKAGDFLAWLDQAAKYTASQFTRNENMVTLSVNDILFKQPVHSTDRIELNSRVIHVRNHTLEVSIDITVHALNGEQYTLDPVDLQLLNYGPSGEKRRITTGLLMDEADQESLRRYIRARTRYAFWKSNPESHLMQKPH